MAMSSVEGNSNELGGRQQVTFWLGCHVLRHSDIIHACIAILERLDVDVQAVGGPRYCCGTIKDMNVRAATTMGQGVVKRFNKIGRDTVISYCPSCQTHLDDFISETTQTEFDFGHFVTFLYEHREKLASQLRGSINRKVAIHLHSGFQTRAPINLMTRELLSLIPGLEVVDHDTYAPGNHCTSGMVALPGMADDLKASVFRLREELGLDDIVTIFHSCQRALCLHDNVEGLRVVNFVKLIATSMGIPCEEDLYRDWKTAGGADEVRRAVGDSRIDRIGASAFESLVLPELKKS